MEQQEYLLKLSMIEQEANRLEQQMQIMDQQIQEMQAIKASLENIEARKGEGELLSNLGKGIFIKTEIKDKDLFINVGKNVIVKKTPKETINVLDDQVKKLIAGKEEIISKIEELRGEMQALIGEAEKAKQKEE